MECGICEIIMEEDFMIPGKYGFGICIDCARKLIGDIIDIIKKEDPQVAGDLIAERLAQARLLNATAPMYA